MQEDLNGNSDPENPLARDGVRSGHVEMPTQPATNGFAAYSPAEPTLPRPPLPGLVKLFLAQQYILALGLFFMAVVCLLLAGWLGGVALLFGLGLGGVGIVCCVSIYRIHTRSPDAPSMCAGFTIFLMVVNVLAALFIGVQIFAPYYYGYMAQLWAGLLSMVAYLPALYGLQRYFRASRRVAGAFNLPERDLPVPTMALGVFRVFCAVMLVGTVGILLLAAFESANLSGGQDKYSGMVLLFYLAACLPQLIFPLIGLVMTARWQEAGTENRQPGNGLEAARNRLPGRGIDGPGFLRLLAVWIAVGAIWPALTGYAVFVRFQSYDGYIGGMHFVMNFPISRGLLPLIIGAFLWRFATVEEERNWLGVRVVPVFSPGRLGAILTFGLIAVRTASFFVYRLVALLLDGQKSGPLDEMVSKLASPLLEGLACALALYSIFLLVTRHHNASPVGRSAAVFGLVSGAAAFVIQEYFKLRGGNFFTLSLLYSATQLLGMLLSCGIALYFLVRMQCEEEAAGTEPGARCNANPGERMRPLGVAMFQFFCGMAFLTNLNEFRWISKGPSGYFNELYHMLPGVWTILLPLLDVAYFFLPVAALLLARRKDPCHGPLLPVLYLWLLSIPGRMLSSALLDGRFGHYGILPSYFVQFVMFGVLGFTWYFHSQRK